MSDVLKIKATLMYPYLDKPNDRFQPDNPKHEVTLAQLSPQAVDAIKDLGMKVYEKEGMGNKISCKSVLPIKVFNTNGEEMDNSNVGNGTEAVAMISFYENKYGRFPQLNKLIITKLVEYSPNNVGAGVDDDLDVL
jgi:hypothetical protein